MNYGTARLGMMVLALVGIFTHFDLLTMTALTIYMALLGYDIVTYLKENK